MDHQPNESQYYSSRMNTKKGKGRECCMCGDVGFEERLFRCHRCNHRFQHICTPYFSYVSIRRHSSRYCSRLYSDQLEFEGVKVCDWCLDLEAKEKNKRQKKEDETQEMVSEKAKEVAAMKQAASVTIEKPRKANAKPTLKRHVKFGRSKERQLLSNSIQNCKLSNENCRNWPRAPRPSKPTKGGLGRRYKLLSDVLCS